MLPKVLEIHHKRATPELDQFPFDERQITLWRIELYQDEMDNIIKNIFNKLKEIQNGKNNENYKYNIFNNDIFDSCFGNSSTG